MNNAIDQKKEILRHQVASESEFDKQRALLEQKIEFLEKAVEDSARREKDISTELKSCKKDFYSQNKELTTSLEKQIKDQSKSIDELKEQLYELETKNSELELLVEEKKNNLNDTVAHMQKELNKARDSEIDLNRKYQELKKKYDQDCSTLKNNQENEKVLNQ